LEALRLDLSSCSNGCYFLDDRDDVEKRKLLP
jgi:hypothetical protein